MIQSSDSVVLAEIRALNFSESFSGAKIPPPHKGIVSYGLSGSPSIY